jgi:hypothetical protein
VVVSPAFIRAKIAYTWIQEASWQKGAVNGKQTKEQSGPQFLQHTMDRQCDQEMKHGGLVRGLSSDSHFGTTSTSSNIAIISTADRDSREKQIWRQLSADAERRTEHVIC